MRGATDAYLYGIIFQIHTDRYLRNSGFILLLFVTAHQSAENHTGAFY